MLGDRADVLVQLPFAAGDLSEPEPDVAVVPVSEPTHPSKAILIIEVAQSSLKEDRGKASLYAAAAVPEYWIINLVDNVIERHAQLKNGAYTKVTNHGRGEPLAVPSFEDVTLRIDELILP